MTDYPLPTLAAEVTSTGISAPSYEETLTSLQASYRAIYGSDVYLEEDSQDGQWLAALAQAIYDTNSMAIAVYNAFSPTTAQGAGLSSVVKINGLARLVPSHSTVTVTIVGQAGTIITNGVVTDDNNNAWDLPATVTIPLDGDISVTATAQVLGDIDAAAGTVTTISTPTRGWQSVTNPGDATIGSPVESDATLRRRQASSTSQAALTVLESMVGAISNLAGVTAVAAYENDTSATNSLGIPEHSVALVVEGGDVTTIAETIAAKKAPGTGTYGTTTEVVFDRLGIPATISFYEPTQVTISVEVTVTPKTGYVSTTGTAMKAAIAAYVGGLGIGAGDPEGTGYVYLDKVNAVAALMGTGLENTFNITLVRLKKNAGSFSAADVAIAFNELTECAASNVTLIGV